MLVVALDTGSRRGSCALAVDGDVRAELASDPALPQAAQLPADLQLLLAQANVRLEDVDVFAVAIGPGSFTGLRVGIATMQGLAFAGDRPLIGVSALDALASIAHATAAAIDPPARTATWVEAWRGDVYAAVYDGTREVEPLTIDTPERVLGRLAEGALFIGDAVPLRRTLITDCLGGRARFAPEPAPLLAGAIARLAHAAASAGQRPAPDAIRPLYVRRADAETARDAHAGR